MSTSIQSDSDVFLIDDDGEIKEQRYRISKAVSSEALRRAAAMNFGSASAAQQQTNPSFHQDGANMEQFPQQPPNDNNNNRKTATQDAAKDPMMPGGERPPVQLRPRTKLEQTIMDRIPERQRQNLVQDQVVGGKVFRGKAFLAEPSVALFDDFDVGKVYKRKIQLTNVSQSFNAYKVLQMPQNVRDIFDVVFTPQSNMSAGMSAYVTIVFSPKENIDVETELPLLARTGPFAIPIKCTRKRVVIAPSTTLLDFGTVVVAEQQVRTLTLTNSGALPTKFSISGADELLNLLHRRSVKQQTHNTTTPDHHVFEMVPDKLDIIRIHPFSSLTFSFTFSPMECCEVDKSLYLSFDDDDEVDDIVVFVQGRAVDVPVFVYENSLLDMQCCFFDTLYRDRFTVKNTTSSAVRVQPEVPTSLRGTLEFVPVFGFAQPDGGLLDFQVKFTPRQHLGGAVDTDITINVHDQAMPIFCRLRASLSPRQFIFDPPSLQYGIGATSESLSQDITITNVCRVAQRMTFARVPANIRVSPHAINMAPNEHVKVSVALQPLCVGSFQQTLTVCTEHNDTYTLPLSGHGKPSVITMTPSNIQLPACAINDSVSVSVLLSNASTSVQRIAFDVHKSYCVSISPAIAELQKGETIPVVVTFAPTEACVAPIEVPDFDAEDPQDAAHQIPPRPNSRTGGKKKSKADEEAERRERERQEEEHKQKLQVLKLEHEQKLKELAKLTPWEESSSSGGERWSMHRDILIACHVENWSVKAAFLAVRATVLRPLVTVSLPSDASRGSPKRDSAGGQQQQEQQQQQQQVAAAAAPTGRDKTPRKSIAAAGPTVVTEPTSPIAATATTTTTTTTRKDKHGHLLEFGAVPILHSVKRSLLIKNNAPFGTSPIRVQCRPLDPFGPFVIHKPPTSTLAAQTETEIIISFNPKSKAMYRHQIVVETDHNNVLLNAVGEGLPASLSIALDKAQLNSDAASAPKLDVAMGHCLAGDRSEQPLFFANTSPFPLSVVLTFEPNTVSAFNANATIPFALTPNKFTIPINGKVEVAAVFAPFHEDNFKATVRAEFGGEESAKHLVFTGNGWQKGLFVQFPDQCPEEYNAKDPFVAYGDLGDQAKGSQCNPHVIAFTARTGTSAVSSVLIGNNKGSSNGEISVEGLTDADTKNGWKVDPVKNTVAPGTKSQNVTVTFTPTQLLMDYLPLRNIGVVSIANVRFVVKGGTPAQDAVYHVQLKGSAWQ